MFSHFLDPKNDMAFKRVFGTEKNKDILIHFLNDLVVFKEEGKIKEATFLKPVQDFDVAINKASTVDVLCCNDRGNQYIVEMQISKQKEFVKKAQSYAAQAYIS